GVSNTRASPNSSYNPSVARKTPPFLPTSSPKINTLLSCCISSFNAAVTASIYEITAILIPPITLRIRISMRIPVLHTLHYLHSPLHHCPSRRFHVLSLAPSLQ